MGAATAAVTYPTRFGDGWVAFRGEEVIALGLPGTNCPHPRTSEVPPVIAALAADLAGYWSGGALPAPSDEMMTAAARTDLDGEIYAEVSSISPGSTKTYSAVADSVGRPGAARAVGAAMAANRFAPMIPCHRVVGSDGSLRGYAGGLAMKRYLLEMEAADG